MLGLPEWVGKLVFLLLLVCLPLALIFAWAFELTPEGIKREREVDRTQSITGSTGRRLDVLIITVLFVAVGFLLLDRFLLPETTVSTQADTETAADTIEDSPSVAVLPFENMSADENSEYFSDGLADTILHMLAQVRELRVAARTSSFQFRGQSLDIRDIGEQLDVGAVLEGSVQRAGDTIRVTAQLIDVSSGYHLWSGNFDRKLEDVFAIQDEIAMAVVSALKVSLLEESVRLLGRDQTSDIDSYTEYLLGINYLNALSTDAAANAIRHFEEAIRLDPNYAQAHAELARAYFESVNYGYLPSIEGLSAARDAAGRALALFPESSTAITVLGLAELTDGNVDQARQILGKAIEMDPNNAYALLGYATYLSADNRAAESIEAHRQVLRIDPLSASAYAAFARTLMIEKRYAEAKDVIATLKRIHPTAPDVPWEVALMEWYQGNLADAAAAMIDGYSADRKDPEFPASIGVIYLDAGMPNAARPWFDRAVEINAQRPAARAAPIWMNYYLQQNDEETIRLARELLEDKVDERWGAREIALRFLVDYADRTGRHEVALNVLQDLHPDLFEDPPQNLEVRTRDIYWTGRALYQSGDAERGRHLMQVFSDRLEPANDAARTSLRIVVARLILEDTDGALEKLAAHRHSMYDGYVDQLELERNSIYDSIRDEPVFIEVLEAYRENAAKQRQLLSVSN